MADLIPHRGPDDTGQWADPKAEVAFGFRRLAIIDLSEAGHQPMASPTGRFVMVYNGEIYNYRDLRIDLERAGDRFRGHSDTEVLLAGFERWGIRPTMERAAGMFGIAVWDRQLQELTLIRDRMGIKPVFVARVAGGIAFASELKAFRAVPGFDPEPDPAAAAAYLRYLYVPDPRTIFRNAFRLPPGHLLTIRDPHTIPDSVPYWSLEEVARAGTEHPFQGDAHEAEATLTALLGTVIEEHLASDVPLGSFLSGGIDSSLVTAIMQSRRTDPVKTYCIGFEDPAHNEAQHAAEVAAYLGTEHQLMPVTGQDALDLVPSLAAIFDEPFADVSQLPAALLCKLARREVTVALSGEGGDEIFGGYNRYTYAAETFQRLDRIPRQLRPALGRILSLPRPAIWDRMAAILSPALPRTARHRLAGEKVGKVVALLTREGTAERYRSLVSAWADPAHLLLNPEVTSWDPIDAALADSDPADLMGRLLLADQLTYLPGDQLTRADRVSMAASLELRVPLLDHRVVELSWQLPMGLKIQPGRGKDILRKVLYRYVPADIVERPKVGFSVPLARWLRGPLREWASSLLEPAAIARGNLLDPTPIQYAWKRFSQGRTELAQGLWAILMLRAWEDLEWSQRSA
jgi:asparagine synthase (glutamine-hydrolysing)